MYKNAVFGDVKHVLLSWVTLQNFDQSSFCTATLTGTSRNLFTKGVTVRLESSNCERRSAGDKVT